MIVRRAWHALAVVALVAATLAFSVERGSAHKAITSPYTYNDDVFPILRDRCGRCHEEGGVAPMSLLTHAETVPWGESIRVEVLAGHMPPAASDGAPARFRNAPSLSPREMNVLLTWVTGGTPIGSADREPKPAARERTWPLGSPDLALPLPSATIAADAHQRTSEFVIATGLKERRWVRAVDLLPGNATVVRAASIAVRAPAPSTSAGSERLLALWLPGEQPSPLDAGLGFELPASAELVVRLLYRKTWEHEREEMRDRSAVGIYFAPASATAVQAVRLAPDSARTANANRLVFRRTLTEDARALAIYPEVGLDNAAVRVIATRPDGTRVDLISLHPRPDWLRRYWFREPIPLPRGTIIDVTAAVDDETPSLPLSLSPAAATRPDLSSLRVTLNVVPVRR